jgi:multicomponent Na+:H+ antiporter subunit D
VAIGALPRLVLDRVIGPAAGALLDAGAYSRAALGQAARSTSPHIPFTYFAGTEIAATGLSILLGGLLVTGYLRSREPLPVRLLRSAHNGSVNDYAAYAVAGTVLVVTLLALA